MFGLTLGSAYRIGLSVLVPAIFGLMFVVAACGFFLNKGWGRICLGSLMLLVILQAADMLLFIAWRGVGAGRVWLLGTAVVLVLAAICTWVLLAATRPEFHEQ